MEISGADSRLTILTFQIKKNIPIYVKSGQYIKPIPYKFRDTPDRGYVAVHSISFLACSFVYGFAFKSRNFTHMETITKEALHMLTYCRVWPLNSKAL